MDNIIYRPEPQLRSLWRLINLVFFSLIFLVIFAVMILAKYYLFGLILLAIIAAIGVFCLWYISAFFKTLEYRIDHDGVKANRGVFWRKKTTVPYKKITNVDITQGPLERIYGLSQLHLQTAGVAGPEGARAELVIYGMLDCEAMKELVMANIEVPGSLPSPKTIAKDMDAGILQAILEELKLIRSKMDKTL